MEATLYATPDRELWATLVVELVAAMLTAFELAPAPDGWLVNGLRGRSSFVRDGWRLELSHDDSLVELVNLRIAPVE